MVYARCCVASCASTAATVIIAIMVSSTATAAVMITTRLICTDIDTGRRWNFMNRGIVASAVSRGALPLLT